MEDIKNKVLTVYPEACLVVWEDIEKNKKQYRIITSQAVAREIGSSEISEELAWESAAWCIENDSWLEWQEHAKKFITELKELCIKYSIDLKAMDNDILRIQNEKEHRCKYFSLNTPE